MHSLGIRNIIKSTTGLTAIEIRHSVTGLVLSSWVFDGNIKKTSSFAITKRNVPLSHSNVPVSLIGQDETGCLLRTTLLRNSLPEGITLVKRRE